MTHKLLRLERLTIVAILLLPTLFTLILVAGKWPNWWEWVIFERTPMTWMESLLLFAAMLTAVTCIKYAWLLQQRRDSLVWAVIGAGFFYLMLDERLAIHERIRDKVLAPNQLDLPIFSWTSSGDYILLLFMFAGLAGLPFIIQTFRARRAALLSFISAIFIACIAILMDSYDPHGLSLHAQRLEQFIEELLETAAMMMFLISFYLMSGHYLAQLLSEDGQRNTQ